MKKTAAADVVIFGGGIAGLWLLTLVRQAGYSAILFESSTLGGGQTYKSQGIIHGGLKYALQGILTKEALSMSDMPDYWRQCLNGKSIVNLSAVPVLSAHHYLWSPNKTTSKITGFFANLALTSQVAHLSKEHYPKLFQHPDFKGEVFSLDEIVIDVPSLVRELAKANQDAIFKIEPICEKEFQFDEQGQLISATVYMAGSALEIKAQQFIFAAGLGNETIISKLPKKEITMQRRPLHMVLVKTPFDYPLYAHCLGLGLSNRPRLTITTHYTQQNEAVWYLGGQLAEEGVTRSHQEQIAATQQELKTLFPWLDFSSAEYSSFLIDRAEPKQKNGLKPESSYYKQIHNMIIAWPTKLALAPKLADDIVKRLKQINLSPQLCDLRELRAWPMPPVARPIWEEAFCKNID